MFCSQCGNKNAEGVAFCNKCGTKVGVENVAAPIANVVPTPNLMPSPNPVVPLNKNKPQKLIFIIAGVALVAVIAIVAVLFILGYDSSVQMVRNGSPHAFPDITWGQAVDNFMANPSWSSFTGVGGEDVVELSGGITYLGEEVTALIQFTLDRNTDTFEINYISFDGVSQPLWMAIELTFIMFEEFEQTAAISAPPPSAIAERGASGGRIIINQTQIASSQHFPGEFEVTLNYVEFVDRIPRFTAEDYEIWGDDAMEVWADLWGGEYDTPDEGSIFLRSVWTVTNIGTTTQSFNPLFSTLVYDDRFEFDSHGVGNVSVNLAPLSPPATVIGNFMIASQAAESNGSLVINFDIWGVSFVVRSGVGGFAGAQGTSLSNSDLQLVGSWVLDRRNLWHVDVYNFDGSSQLHFNANGTGYLTDHAGETGFGWSLETSNYTESGYVLVFVDLPRYDQLFLVQELTSSRLVLYEPLQGNTYTFVRNGNGVLANAPVQQPVIDTSVWQSFDGISLPPGWGFEPRPYFGSADIYNGYLDGWLGSLSDSWFDDLMSNHSPIEFSFNDGSTGFRIETASEMLWLNTRYRTILGFPIWLDSEWWAYQDNYELFNAIGATLTYSSIVSGFETFWAYETESVANRIVYRTWELDSLSAGEHFGDGDSIVFLPDGVFIIESSYSETSQSRWRLYVGDGPLWLVIYNPISGETFEFGLEIGQTGDDRYIGLTYWATQHTYWFVAFRP